MWAHDVDQPQYAELLASIERMLPGATILDEERHR
jgi:hypothetical protein